MDLGSKILEQKLEGQLDLGRYAKVEAKPGNVKDDKNLRYIGLFRHPDTRKWMTGYNHDILEVPKDKRNSWKIHPSQRRPRVPNALRGETSRRQQNFEVRGSSQATQQQPRGGFGPFAAEDFNFPEPQQFPQTPQMPIFDEHTTPWVTLSRQIHENALREQSHFEEWRA